MDKKDWEAGYDWVVDTIKLDHEYLASKMEIEKALHYLKTKEFDKVIPWVQSKVTTCQCDFLTYLKTQSTQMTHGAQLCSGGMSLSR